MADKTIGQMLDEIRENPSKLLPQKDERDDVRMDAEMFRSRFFGVPLDEMDSHERSDMMRRIGSRYSDLEKLMAKHGMALKTGVFELPANRDKVKQFARDAMNAGIGNDQILAFVNLHTESKVDEAAMTKLGPIAKEMADNVGPRLHAVIQKAREALLSHTELSHGIMAAKFAKAVALCEGAHKPGSVEGVYYDLVTSLLVFDNQMESASSDYVEELLHEFDINETTLNGENPKKGFYYLTFHPSDTEFWAYPISHLVGGGVRIVMMRVENGNRIRGDAVLSTVKKMDLHNWVLKDEEVPNKVEDKIMKKVKSLDTDTRGD